MSDEIKLFIGMEETNINDFRSKCCNAFLSVEPLCEIVCGICRKNASSVDNHYYAEPTIKVSELREWCEANTHQVYSPEHGGEIDYISPYDLKERFCGGV